MFSSNYFIERQYDYRDIPVGYKCDMSCCCGCVMDQLDLYCIDHCCGCVNYVNCVDDVDVDDECDIDFDIEAIEDGS